jgi:hypothetical protein
MPGYKLYMIYKTKDSQKTNSVGTDQKVLNSILANYYYL